MTDKQDFAAATSRVAIKVRRGGVTLTCNDELILDWRSRGEQLSLHQDFVTPNKRALGLAWQAEFAIHQMTLIPGGGDWTPLFNGRDKKDWNSTKPESWKMDSNAAVVVGFGIGKRGESWLLTAREFSDFRLRLEFQLAMEGDGGLGLRFNTDAKASEQLQIQFADDLNLTGRLPTGAIKNLPHGKENDTLPAIPPELKPLGSWNELEIELRGQSLRVWVNGRQVQDVELKASAPDPLKPPDTGASKKAHAAMAKIVPGLTPARGRIGLQIVSGQVRYRNVVIHELK